MPASRKLTRIVIRVDPTTGLARDVEVLMEMNVTENGLTMFGTKIYSKEYNTMNNVAKARLDVLVNDINAFVNAQEPRT